MRVFLYEYVTGGGAFEDPSGQPPSGSLLDEGAAMVRAMAADLVAAGCSVVALRDCRLTDFHLPDVELVEIGDSKAEEYAILLGGAADVMILIAPEIDGALLRRVRLATEAGGELVSPGELFVAVASDKQHALERLEAAGVPVPPGRLLDEDFDPRGFTYPAVLKPCDGAGSLGVRRIDCASQLLHFSPAPNRWRIERLQRGLPASVSFLCGPVECLPLPACRQLLSDNGAFEYLGGQGPLAPKLNERAQILGRAALAALPPAVGYVGVDLVLGDAEDGSEDVVIEINPRLTTSYVGLRQIVDVNLVEAMLRVALKKEVSPPVAVRSVRFTPRGEILPT